MDIEDMLSGGCLMLGIASFVALLLIPIAALIWIILHWN